MHTLTILTLPLPHTPHTLTQAVPTSRETLRTLSSFIRNFFSCEYCREHFSKMSANLTSKLHHDGDAILWLWEAHNTVNKRLQTALSSDPHYPKTLFPGAKTCPYCYQMVGEAAVDHGRPDLNNTGFLPGESLLGGDTSYEYVWNRTAVLLYLWNFYHLNPSSHSQGDSPSPTLHVKPADILKAAWPKAFANPAELHRKYYGIDRHKPLANHSHLGFTQIDTSICLMSYLVCFAFLGVLAYWLYRRKRYRTFLLPY